MIASALDLGSLIDGMTPSERRELDAALVALEQRPTPDLEYQADPVGWAVNVLGIPEHTIRWSVNAEYATHEWDGTPDPLVAMAEGLAAGDDVGVESGTGTGKTYTVGWLVLWFAACHKPALVVTTAPKEDQLTLQLWKEIGNHWRRFKRAYPTAETVQLRVRMEPDGDEADLDALSADAWAIVGYACGVEANQESATRAQGFHSPHMLLVTEETPGVPKPVMTAFANTATGAHNLRLGVGNPDHQHDSLHEFCLEPGVRRVRISSLDHPNVVCGHEVIPGATSRRKVNWFAETYGVDSTMYASRVQGISPPQAADALIQRAWLDASAARYAAAEREGRITGRPALGVDVAQSESGDKASIAFGRGRWLVELLARPCRNATALGRNVFARMQRDGIDPMHVGVDPIGVGAATVNALDELTMAEGERTGLMTRVQHLNGGAAPMKGIGRGDGQTTRDWLPEANTFYNLRAQMWWTLREDLRCGRVDLKHDEALFRQLTLPKSFVKHGKTLVESKDDIKKRTGGKSPDEADSVVYWNWARPRAVLLLKAQRESRDQHPGYNETVGGAPTVAERSRPQGPSATRPGRPAPAARVRPYGRAAR